MTDDWKGLFERGRVIPPHSQTVRQAQDSFHTHSQGFQIILKHLDGPHIQRVGLRRICINLASEEYSSLMSFASLVLAQPGR